MGFWDSVRGRREPIQPDLDQIFALPSAAITLEVSLGMRPTGTGSVAFRVPEGQAFAEVQSEVRQLLDADGGPEVEAAADQYGYTWLVVRTQPPDLPALVTDLHAVNSTLVDAGFGPQLLCSLAAFRDDAGRMLGLVYLYKQGTFYPFAPDAAQPGQQRDNVLELQVRDLLANDMKIEKNLTRWFAIWGAPGLS